MRFLLSLLQVYIIKCPLQSSGLTGCMDCAHFKRTPLSVGYHLQSVGSLHQIYLSFLHIWVYLYQRAGWYFFTVKKPWGNFLAVYFLPFVVIMLNHQEYYPVLNIPMSHDMENIHHGRHNGGQKKISGNSINQNNGEQVELYNLAIILPGIT